MKIWLQFVLWINRKLKALSIRLVVWTGKSKEFVHPKHLMRGDEFQWYLSSLKHSDVVLDLGCGTGMHAIHTAKRASRVKGVDYSKRNLAIAQSLAEAKGLTNISFRSASLEERIDEANQSYTVILALDILEHLNNRDLFLSETYRILNTCGRLFLAVPNIDTKWKRLLKQNDLFYYSDLDHKHEYSREEIVRLLEAHRFKILKIDNTVFDTPWIGIIDFIGGISIDWYRRLTERRRSTVTNCESETTGFRIIAEKLS